MKMIKGQGQSIAMSRQSRNVLRPEFTVAFAVYILALHVRNAFPCFIDEDKLPVAFFRERSVLI
jgi:hypothetical protein